MQRFMKKGNAGYTLVELMVIIAIITTLSALVVSNYPKMQMQFSVTRAAYKFQQDLRRVQGMSLSYREYKDSNDQLQPVAGFGAYAQFQSSQYTLYADSVPGNQLADLDGTDYIVEVVELEPGVIIVAHEIVESSVSINFKPPNPITTLTPATLENSLCVVFVAQAHPELRRAVFINTAGLIEVLNSQDPACN